MSTPNLETDSLNPTSHPTYTITESPSGTYHVYVKRIVATFYDKKRAQDYTSELNEPQKAIKQRPWTPDEDALILPYKTISEIPHEIIMQLALTCRNRNAIIGRLDRLKPQREAKPPTETKPPLPPNAVLSSPGDFRYQSNAPMSHLAEKYDAPPKDKPYQQPSSEPFISTISPDRLKAGR